MATAFFSENLIPVHGYEPVYLITDKGRDNNENEDHPPGSSKVSEDMQNCGRPGVEQTVFQVKNRICFMLRQSRLFQKHLPFPGLQIYKPEPPLPVAVFNERHK